MAIVVNLDLLLVKRKMKLTELASRVDITLANLSVLKQNKARADPLLDPGRALQGTRLPARRPARVSARCAPVARGGWAPDRPLGRRPGVRFAVLAPDEAQVEAVGRDGIHACCKRLCRLPALSVGFMISSAGLWPGIRPGSRHPPPPRSASRRVRAMILEAVQKGGVPSISIAAAEDGTVVWEESFGYADKEKQIKATPESIYAMASISKAFTGTGLMVLAERKLLDLDKPVNDYLGDAKLTAHVGSADQATLRRMLYLEAGMPMHWNIFQCNRAGPSALPGRVDPPLRDHRQRAGPGVRVFEFRLRRARPGHLSRLGEGVPRVHEGRGLQATADEQDVSACRSRAGSPRGAELRCDGRPVPSPGLRP